MQSDKPYKVYFFGSIFFSKTPRDVDVLVLYDRNLISPSGIINAFKPEKEKLKNKFNLEVHSTYLNHEEQEQSAFISRYNCVLLNENAKL